MEKSLLHRFRRRAYPHVEHAITAGEAIFLARHHGLPTRLLDWTANALFSLYFACFEKLDSDGGIWAMLLRKGRQDLDAFKSNLEDENELFTYRIGGDEGAHTSSSDAIKIVYPMYNSPRLLAQDAAFTMHSNPRRSLEWYSKEAFEFTKENIDIEVLYRWCIPKAAKAQIIRDLSGLGITHRSVFPDLDGLARSLLETQVLWPGGRE